MMSEPFTSSSLKTCLKYRDNPQTTVNGRQEEKYPPVEYCLVRTVVEYLQKLTPSQVEHKLRINTKFLRERKAAKIFLDTPRTSGTVGSPSDPPMVSLWR